MQLPIPSPPPKRWKPAAEALPEQRRTSLVQQHQASLRSSRAPTAAALSRGWTTPQSPAGLPRLPAAQQDPRRRSALRRGEPHPTLQAGRARASRAPPTRPPPRPLHKKTPSVPQQLAPQPLLLPLAFPAPEPLRRHYRPPRRPARRDWPPPPVTQLPRCLRKCGQAAAIAAAVAGKGKCVTWCGRALWVWRAVLESRR